MRYKRRAYEIRCLCYVAFQNGRIVEFGHQMVKSLITFVARLISHQGRLRTAFPFQIKKC